MRHFLLALVAVLAIISAGCGDYDQDVLIRNATVGDGLGDLHDYDVSTLVRADGHITNRSGTVTNELGYHTVTPDVSVTISGNNSYVSPVLDGSQNDYDHSPVCKLMYVLEFDVQNVSPGDAIYVAGHIAGADWPSDQESCEDAFIIRAVYWTFPTGGWYKTEEAVRTTWDGTQCSWTDAINAIPHALHRQYPRGTDHPPGRQRGQRAAGAADPVRLHRGGCDVELAIAGDAQLTWLPERGLICAVERAKVGQVEKGDRVLRSVLQSRPSA